jgi:serine protease Do
MNRIRWYGPTIVLLMTVLAVMVAGPSLVRRIAWAYDDERITLVEDGLSHNPTLAELSNAFRKVAQVVEPSVVHVQIFSRQARRSINVPDPHGEIPEEFRQWFFGPHGLTPPDQGDQNSNPAPKRDGDDLNKYDVPQQTGSGSGWVYDTKGHIITNNHVVDGADKIVVRFNNGSERVAKVVGTDPKTDVAVIEVEDSDLHAAHIGREAVEQGDMVFAFGSPLGNEFSMSQGIVSGKGRQIGILNGRSGYENFIQTDAAINPGNSGGPLTNIYGQVIGMNTAIATRTGFYMGIGYAIPVKLVKNVADQIINNGKVRRGYLGIVIDPLEPKLAQTFGFNGRGVLVRYAVEGTPAADAGIKRGDIITKVNGMVVTEPDELRNTVAAMPPDSKVAIEYFRDGKTQTAEIKLAELPDTVASAGPVPAVPAPGQTTPASNELLRKLGLEGVSAMTTTLAEEQNLKFTAGVLVREVRQNSVAWTEGLRKQMIITDVMNVPVKTPEELVTELKKHDLTKGVRVSVLAGDQPVFMLLELDQK